MVYNKVDQLTTWPGMYNYLYDGHGNLQSVRQGSGETVLKGYTYTDDDLLATASRNGNTIITNTWDADGNRVQFVVAGGTYQAIYDITAGIPAVLADRLAQMKKAIAAA